MDFFFSVLGHGITTTKFIPSANRGFHKMEDELDKKRCETDRVQMVTCHGPINMAVVKYCEDENFDSSGVICRSLVDCQTFFQGASERRKKFFR